jgi:hypothetical protein
VVCPSIATDFDVCVQAKPHNDTKTGNNKSNTKRPYFAVEI